jgi:hypothetical protein
MESSVTTEFKKRRIIQNIFFCYLKNDIRKFLFFVLNEEKTKKKIYAFGMIFNGGGDERFS